MSWRAARDRGLAKPRISEDKGLLPHLLDFPGPVRGLGRNAKKVRDKFCTGDFAPPEPEFGAEFCETNFGRPTFGPEFLGRSF